MKKRYVIPIILCIFLLSWNFAAAGDVNSTELSADDTDTPVEMDFQDMELSANDTDNPVELDSTDDEMEYAELNNTESAKMADNAVTSDTNNKSDEKIKTYITLKTNHLKTKDKLTIFLKDENGYLVKYKNFTVTISKKTYTLKTNSKGTATLSIDLPAKTYKVRLIFRGDDKYDSANKAYSVSLSKINTAIGSYKTVIIKNTKIYAQLKDAHNFLAGKKINIIINGKTYYRKTGKKGQIDFPIKLSPSRYNIIIKFTGDPYYKASSKNFKIYILNRNSFVIGNDKLITNGFLRLYLNDLPTSLLSNQKIHISVGDKKFFRSTDKEGIIIIKPQVKRGSHMVTAQFKTLTISKKISCYAGNPKNPLNEITPFHNGMPDVDIMAWNFVKGSDTATYTLLKSQYRDVMRQDSYCLFLYNRLTKYTLFKTKQNPNYYHILKREKWNVIEKEVNRQIVNANRHGYWPSQVTACLNGRAYTYPEVRDVQDTEYTCGPTSCSMCSQVLKNYYCESHLASLAGTTYDGTTSSGMAYSMECHEFTCSYYFRTSFDYALNELKKGGCALVFHTKNHYVAILDISDDGEHVLVSNSYGDYYNIPSTWLSVNYMKTRYYKDYDDALIIKLDYHLSQSTMNQLHRYYYSMGSGWFVHNMNEVVS